MGLKKVRHMGRMINISMDHPYVLESLPLGCKITGAFYKNDGTVYHGVEESPWSKEQIENVIEDYFFNEEFEKKLL